MATNPTTKNGAQPTVTIQAQLLIGFDAAGNLKVDGPALQNFAQALGLLEMAKYAINRASEKASEQLVQKASFMPPTPLKM